MLWIRHLRARDVPVLIKDLIAGAAWSLRHWDRDWLLGRWAAWRGTARAYAEGWEPGETLTVEQLADSVGRRHVLDEEELRMYVRWIRSYRNDEIAAWDSIEDILGGLDQEHIDQVEDEELRGELSYLRWTQGD